MEKLVLELEEYNNNRSAKKLNIDKKIKKVLEDQKSKKDKADKAEKANKKD